MKFTKARYLQLLKESNKLQEQGKDLYKSDPIKYHELHEYLLVLENDIFWKSRFKYLEIIERFINKNIGGIEFEDQFGNLRKENMDEAKMQKTNLENEIDFNCNPKSYQFAELISYLYAVIDVFDPSIDDNRVNLFAMGEEGLRLFIKDRFLSKIQYLCKKS